MTKRLPIVVVVLILCAGVAAGQSNPTPFALSAGDYTLTNWPSTSGAGTYPPNMIFHQHGNTTDPTLTTEPTQDWTLAYNLTSGARILGLGAGGFSFVNASTTRPYVGAAVLSLNTTGMSTVRVAWTGTTVAIDATTRDYRLRLQYRVGTSGAWADVPGPIEYTATSPAGHFQNFGPTILPSAVNNQPVVQVRWKYYQVGGSNTRPQLSVSNILVAANAGSSSGDGTGSVRISPDTLVHGAVGPVNFVYRRDTQFAVNALRIFVSPFFSWSRSATDVSFTNMTATTTISGDTITLSSIVFSADSTRITIANVTPPDSTGIYSFRMQSRENAYADIGPTPKIVVFGIPMTIADAKTNNSQGVPLRLNQLITVRGVVTVSNQFGSPSYIQDNTGGMAVFGSIFSNAVQLGDEVIVSGTVQPFNGLFEIVSPILNSIVSSGNVVVPPVVTCAQVANDGQNGVELYEGSFVRLNGVTVTGTGNWAGNTNYPLNDASGTSEIRISVNSNLVGQPIPAGAFDLLCVVGQFKSTPPYIGGYQVMPRFTADVLASGPLFATSPVETDIQQTSLTIGWQTLNNGSTHVRYGTTPAYELGVVGSSTPTTTHSIQLSGLSAATVYYIQAFSIAGSDTSTATPLIACTASPSASTGTTNVYFNKSVYTGVATIQPALGNENLVNRILTRLNNAKRSIDAALYSLSGSPGDQLASALVNAKNRGVRVRVICENDNRNSTSYNFIANNGIPLITDTFDPINAGAGLHHNKFFVIDALGGAPESVWVWTGSWNPTFSGTNDDFQNSIEFQDVSLAKAYTMEFEEEWGSSTETPNAANSRFGARKLDNTPHRFSIGGRWVESYFSPSDRTTSHIVSTIAAAQHSIGFCIYSFTRTDVANAIIARHVVGKKTRGTMDNSGPSELYSYLFSNNVDVWLKTGVSGSTLLHHKYATIDGENASWNGVTITGSHNWSNNAENSNNENTVIVYDPNIANQYLQEFAARYYQFGGTDSITVNVQDEGLETPGSFALAQNYPNPFNPETVIRYAVGTIGGLSQHVTLKIYNVLGQEVATLVNEVQHAGQYRVRWNAATIPSGLYVYRLSAGSFVESKKMLLLK
jgi:phosphatidylserine/phosphatidylglycerophosphate/cardiolipin synthase-like enzyme